MPEFNIEAILKQIPQGAESVFDKAEYDRRLAALRKEMSHKGFDLLLTSGSENIFYLTGQQTPTTCLSMPRHSNERRAVSRSSRAGEHECALEKLDQRYRGLCR